jgi:hypothetical protein
VQVKQMAFQRIAEAKRPVQEGQRRRAQSGHEHDGPDAPPVEQHRAERHLQQVEGDEGVGRPAAEVKLSGQQQHVEQQRQQQFRMRHVLAMAQRREGDDVEDGCDRRDHQHAGDGQGDAHRPMDEQDRRHLPGDRDPPQLHQQRHVLPARSVGWPLAGQPARADRQARLHDRRSFHSWRMSMM